MKLTFLGAAREVGRSGILVEAGKRILLDHGVKLGARTEYPMPFQGFVDAYVLSHAHLDHSGFSPALYENANIPCFAAAPTLALSSLLLQDSLKIAKINQQRLPFSPFLIRKFEHASIPLGYRKPFPLERDTTLTLLDAGHIPGAAITEIYSEHKRLVYTGDFKLEETRLHRGADFAEKIDILLTESTYSESDHPPRKEIERKLKASVKETLARGGNVLFPAFAVGRSQELLMLMAELVPEADVYLDGMSRAATEIIADYPSYIRDANALRKGMRNAEWVVSQVQRKKALSKPSVIISSAGMLEGGPALSYLLGLNEFSKIILTGFQIAGTNARRLWETRTVNVDEIPTEIKQEVEYYDMSAHAGRSDLFKFVKRANPEKVFCVHGDHCEKFAEELCGMGFEAYAPMMGKTFEV